MEVYTWRSGSGWVRVVILEQSGAENLRPMAMEFPPDLDLRAKLIYMESKLEHLLDMSPEDLSEYRIKVMNSQVWNLNTNISAGYPTVASSLKDRVWPCGIPLMPSPAASSVGYPDSPTLSSTENLALHAIGHIINKYIRPSYPEGLQSIERLGKCISAGHVAIQSVEVEETELACYLRNGGLAPVTSGGNNFPKRTTGGKGTNIPLRRRRLFTLSFKESGQTSAVVIDIGEAQWIVDSGASASLTGDSSLLEGLHTTEVMYFRVANGQIVSSNTCGRASGLVNLSGIRYSPGCHQNIISARHLINLGCVVTFDGEGCSIRKNGVLIGKAPPATEPEGLFYLDYLRDAQLGSICWACPHPTVQGN